MGLGRKKAGPHTYYLRGGVGPGDLSMASKNLHHFLPLNVYPMRHGVGILTFSFKKIQIPHPPYKIIGQNPHPAASEGGKMSFVTIKIFSLGTSHTIKIPTLGTDLTWLARPPLPGA